MPVRMALTRVTGQGEQLVIDIAQWNPVTGEIIHKDATEMSQLADEMLKLSDTRIMEMNLRGLEAYNLERFFDPPVWARIVSILDVLSGRMTAETLRRRWEAEEEETLELERGRLEHMKLMEGQLELDLDERTLKGA